MEKILQEDRRKRMFEILNENELQEVEGGLIGTICAVIGTGIVVYRAIYALGYAQGQAAGYKQRK